MEVFECTTVELLSAFCLWGEDFSFATSSMIRSYIHKSYFKQHVHV